MIIPILLLILSVIFLAKVLNISKLFLAPTKPSNTSPQRQENSSPTPTSTMKKDDLKHVFDTFDRNKDGFITKQELKESLSNIGMYVTSKEVDEMVEKLDANKDGLIDVEEFRRIFELENENTRAKEVNGGNEFNIGKEKGSVDDYEVDLKEAFDVFDGDKDGLITVKELGMVLSSMGLSEGRRDEYCVEMIRKVDADGDGMVSFDEFKRMMRADSGAAVDLNSAF